MDTLRGSAALVLTWTIAAACGPGDSASPSIGTVADGGFLFDAGSTSCLAAPGGTCRTGGAYCGTIGCCPPGGGSFACAATGRCYLTQAEATVACGARCVACTTGGGGLADAGVSDGGAATCQEAPDSKCGTGYVSCGGTDCCDPAYPYTCPSSPKCFRTAEAAIAACGSDPCVHCR